MSTVIRPTSAPELPTTIKSFIAAFDSLRRKRTFWRALGLSACFSVVWILACCLADRLLKLNTDVRLALLVLHAVAVVLILAMPTWRMLRRRIDWMDAAEQIESRDRPLAGRLQTVTSQSLESEPSFRGSAQIIERLTADVEARLTVTRPDRLVPKRPVARAWLLTLCSLVIASAVLRLETMDLPTLVLRYFMPTMKIAPVTTTRLSVYPGDTSIVEGSSLPISVQADRLNPERPVKLFLWRGGSWGSMKSAPDPINPDIRRTTIPDVDQDLRYYVAGGDAVSPIYNVSVLRKPVVRQLLAQCDYPPYTRTSPETVAIADGALQVPTGTRIALSIITSVPVARAQLLREGEASTIEMSASDRPDLWQTTVDVDRNAEWRIELTSTSGVRSSAPATLRVQAVADQPPAVRLIGMTGEVRLQPRDIIELPYKTSDDWSVESLTLRLEVQPSQAVEAGTLTNVARGKPTTQSSTVFEALASRAVDGNSSGVFSDGTVTHTGHAEGNFWQVDLGAITPISIIEVWNRTDAAPDRLRDFQVLISDEAFDAVHAGRTSTTQPGVEVIEVEGVCGTPTVVDVYRSGRYVRVELPQRDYLSLAEVKIYDATTAASEWGEEFVDYGDAFAPDALRAFEGGPTIIEREVKLPEPGKDRDGQIQLDLAELDLRLGDVVSVSLHAVDTSGQSGSSDASRILISPRSVDPVTYRRIRELEGAVSVLRGMSAELTAARAALVPQKADTPLVAPRLASVHQHLAGAAENGRRSVTSLLRAIAQNMPPTAATATAALIDGVEAMSGEANLISEILTSGGAAGAETTAARIQQVNERIGGIDLALITMLEGEKAAVLLAEIENLSASQRVPPQATREAAERVRERLARMEQNIAAAARELALDPATQADLQGQLKRKVEAAALSAASHALIDFTPVVAAWVEQLKRQSSLPRDTSGSEPLTSRLEAASQAEALRRDADVTRARDLSLVRLVVGRLASQAGLVPSPASTTSPAPTPDLLPLVAALHREHQLNRATTAPDPNADEIRAAARAARAKLNEFILPAPETNGATAGDNMARPHHDLEMALRAELLADAGNYAEVAKIDRQLARRSERSSSGLAWSRISRLNSIARRIQQLADAQAALLRQTGRASTQPSAHAELAEQQARLTEAIHDAMMPDDGRVTEADSRQEAEAAMRSARQILSSLPTSLSNARTALADRNIARDRAETARKRADAAGLEQWAAANRAAVAAELQRQESEARFQQAAAAVESDVAEAMADALRPFAPETVEAVRVLDEQLAPALAGVQQASAAGDASAVEEAFAEASNSAGHALERLRAAHLSLLDNDPMLAARAASSAAMATLVQPISTASSQNDSLKTVESLQREAADALNRAAGQANRSAAMERLSVLPSMSPLLAASPPAASAIRDVPAPDIAPNPAPSSLFQALRGWGQLPWRLPGDLTIAAGEIDPPGYRDALDAYFLTIQNAQAKDAAAPATQEAQ